MAIHNRKSLLVATLLFLVVATHTTALSENKLECVYTLYVKTGLRLKAGTNSVVNVTLYDSEGYSFTITNLEKWGGQMDPNWDYFERGNLDIFSARGPCMPAKVPCLLVLGIDGSGHNPDWYCKYVELTVTGPNKPCAQQLFTVEHWLGPDTKLTYSVNLCKLDSSAKNIQQNLPSSGVVSTVTAAA